MFSETLKLFFNLVVNQALFSSALQSNYRIRQRGSASISAEIICPFGLSVHLSLFQKIK